jgi:hypothetical protein
MAPVVVLCDGTWCGRETGTESNISELAKIIGINVDNPDPDGSCYLHTPHTIHARYHNGVGLGSTFLDYLFNGVTAQDLADECINAYRFIVNHYRAGDEIWLFGLSRGAYTVRCVAGMINNCGIVRNRGTELEISLLCREVYRIYRSRDDINAPGSRQSIAFRKRKSWPLIGDEAKGESRRLPPVRFMGIFDTVGELGIPTFTGGVGLDWPTFYDNKVSHVVDQVCHLVSLHDRFYIFQPCLASREDPTLPGIHEEWLPGVHYDLGRQSFRFFRLAGGSLLERVLARWNFANMIIEPNSVLADLALLKMLKSIEGTDVDRSIISTATLHRNIRGLQEAIVAPCRSLGDGDVYANITKYGPFGRILMRIFTMGSEIAPAVMQLLFDLRDRLIPGDNAGVYAFEQTDSQVSEEQSIESLAKVTGERYPSKTLQMWQLRRSGTV